jgi:hypothetical protein
MMMMMTMTTMMMTMTMMMMMITQDDATNGVDDNDDVCYSDEHGDSVMALPRNNMISYEITFLNS